jgi:hypothetical protein
VDNAFSKVIRVVGNDDPGGQGLSENARNGAFTLLVQITNYNGLANDDAVGVAFVAVADPTCDGGCLAPADGGDAHPIPTFLPGVDTWQYFATTQFVPESTVAVPIVTGYVTDHTLVVDRGDNHLGSASIPLSSGATIELLRPMLTARLGPSDGGGDYELHDVVVGGIVPAGQLLDFARSVRLGSNEAVCGSPLEPLLKTAICKQRDVRQDMATDASCDAISFGFGFDAVRAYLGHKIPDPPSACSNVPLTCD